MGGNALRQFGIETVRLPKADYDTIVSEVVDIIENVLDHNGYIRKVKPILAYKNKPDFGDLDVLMDSDELHPNWIELLKNAFNSKAYYHNGDVVSFEYKNFQVDVIKTPIHEFDAAYHYFAYNDCGNLMGRLTHQFGLKLGHDGLTYVYRDGDQVIGEIVITRDFHEVCWFLGLDYQVWKEGFNELEDIFKWVATSKYFNPDIYLLHNRNHTSRTRDRKRKSYMEFLKWCETYDGPKYERLEDKTKYLPMLFDFFGKDNGWCEGFEDQYMHMYAEHLKRKDMQSKFNGDMVREVTKLEGKELGEFMQVLRKEITPVFIITQSPETIAEKVKLLYNEFVNKEPK